MHTFLILVGVALLFVVLRSMVHVALLNRHDMNVLAGIASRTVHRLIGFRVRTAERFEEAQETLHWFFAYYIISLTVIYFVGAMLGFGCIYWGASTVTSWHKALIDSGSALTTVGFSTPTSAAGKWLTIPEGALGLCIIVYLFTFVPGFQAAISARDVQTSWLYARLPNQSNRVDLVTWFEQLGHAQDQDGVWDTWEGWFRQLADSHVTSPMFSVVPSNRSGQSWIVAAGVVLDAAAFSVSTMNGCPSASGRACVRSGSEAVCSIAESLRNSTDRRPVSSASTSRQAYDELCEQLMKRGFHLQPDREASWKEFAGLRSGYAGSISYLAERAFVPLVDTLVQEESG
jgi:hypothetical protein